MVAADGCEADGRVAWSRATLDASGDSYTVLRAVREDSKIVDWLVVDANALVRQRWSSVVGEVVGVRASRLDAATDNSRFTELYAAALETGEQQVVEAQLNLPAAMGGWRRVVVTPVDRETVTVVTRDITREKQLEARLETPRDRAREVRQDDADDLSGRALDARFASRSATALFLGAGALTLLNGLFVRPGGVDLAALRLTGALSMAAAFVVPVLPWRRHLRMVAASLSVVALTYLVVSDRLNHYSRSASAVAVYPVFFIIVIAWSGLTGRRGAATVAAVASIPAINWILGNGRSSSVVWQCVLVAVPAAAILGETLSWYRHRADELARREAQRQFRDDLTGLANRALLTIELDRALAHARRTHRAVAVLFVDVDRFKQVNDTLGHGAGDELLIEIAARLRNAVREEETVARLGGDEFIVLCEDIAGAQEASEIAERLLVAVSTPFMCGSSEIRATLSIGIAVSTRGLEPAETIMQHADTALYRAKEAGRARYELFDDTMRERVAARNELELALRHAAARGELRLHFQPVVSADTGRVASFEALVRWERPGYGLVPPAEFIAVAEECGFIFDIGAWVLTRACEEAASWNARWPGRRLGITVNLSGHQILRGDAREVVEHVLATTGLDPHLLTLELTETTLIDDAIDSEPLLQALRSLGIKIAIDDFGTGYSSLAYLRRLPIDIIKIDQSFVRAIGTELEDIAIVSAVINLAHSLNLDVVAEGVETPEQHELLVRQGCKLLQGFLYGRPEPPERVAGLIEHELRTEHPYEVVGGIVDGD